MKTHSRALLLSSLLFFALPAKAESDSLFVVLGGYNSCYENHLSNAWPYHTVVWNQFNTTVAPAVEDATGNPPEYLAGCYGIATRKPLDYYLNFRFLSSGNPEEQDLFTTPFFGPSTYQNYSNVVDTLDATLE
jgi:hypothetical protein